MGINVINAQTDRQKKGTVHAGTVPLFFFLVIFATAAFATDWPQYLGPNKNGITGEAVNLPGTELWRTNVGRGYGQVVVSGGRVYVEYEEDLGNDLSFQDAMYEQLWSKLGTEGETYVLLDGNAKLVAA